MSDMIIPKYYENEFNNSLKSFERNYNRTVFETIDPSVMNRIQKIKKFLKDSLQYNFDLTILEGDTNKLIIYEDYEFTIIGIKPNYDYTYIHKIKTNKDIKDQNELWYLINYHDDINSVAQYHFPDEDIFLGIKDSMGISLSNLYFMSSDEGKLNTIYFDKDLFFFGRYFFDHHYHYYQDSLNNNLQNLKAELSK